MGMAILAANHPVLSFAPLSLHTLGRRTSTSIPSDHGLRMAKLPLEDGGIGVPNANVEFPATKRSTDPTPVLYKVFQKTVSGDEHKKNSNYMKLAAGALAIALAFLPLSSEAAMSGGRMGGSYSRSPTVRSSPRSYSSPSRTYNQGYSRGYTSGYYSRPSVVVTPGTVSYTHLTLPTKRIV